MALLPYNDWHQLLPYSNEGAMKETTQNSAVPPADNVTRFNYHKLQAVLCITASAAASIGLIAWLITFIK